jgi:hypothetical protein
MAPRGIKAALKKSAPAALVGMGKFRGFAIVRQGKKTNIKLRGLTKRIEKKLWSKGTLPLVAKRSDTRPGGHWRGPKGGQKRGKRVDAQLTRIVNAGPAAMKKEQHLYRLTRMVLSGLSSQGLEPVLAQRAVISQSHRIATAPDIIAYNKQRNQLTLVELKCGYPQGRAAAARDGKGKACNMRGPLSKASDCNLHRHMTQLAITRELFSREGGTLDRLGELGLEREVAGVLLYACDEGVESHALTDWWKRRAAKALDAVA